ncbi:MAG TPA: hypothetical protein VNB94_13695 [Mycobacteriales bacterium]|nr:hypothetical protein [Mycobacteriales bacterium]
MKRIASLVALTGLIVVPAVSDAAPKPPKRVERTVTVAYTGACQVGIDGANGGINGCPNALNDAAKVGESFVKFSAKDATGLSIGLVSYDPTDFAGTAASVCGGIAKAMKIKAKKEFGIKTVIDPTCGAVPTQGTLTMTFSNLP